jgi:hypothetical protein
MAISHLCTNCGSDLARIRARREPLYGLPLVVCPRCGICAVRRRHPLQRRYRSGKRLALSLAVLAAQLGLLAAFISLTTAVCVQFGEDFMRGGVELSRPEMTVLAVLSFGALPLALGAWLKAGLPHWRGAIAWLVFALFMLPLLSIDTLLLPWLARSIASLNLALQWDSCRWDLWLGRVSALGVIMLVALLGIPIGTGLVRLNDMARRGLWRLRLRRARTRRAIA